MRFLLNSRGAGQWLAALWFVAGSLSAALADYPILTNPVPARSAPTTNAASDSSNGFREDGRLSPWLAEFLKLVQAGLEEEVLFSFVSNTEGTFNLTADQIIGLRDLGVSGFLINALIEHDRELTSGSRELKGASVPGEGALLPVLAHGSSASQPVTVRQSLAGDGDSIIVRDHVLEGSIAQVTSEEPEVVLDAAGGVDGRVEPKVWRVRKPHSVRLTDPILVFRSTPRIPNVFIIQPLR